MDYRISKIYNRKLEVCAETGDVIITSYNKNVDVDEIVGRLNNSRTCDFDYEISRLESFDYDLFCETDEEKDKLREEIEFKIQMYKELKKQKYIKNKKRSISRAINKLFRYAELNSFQYIDINNKPIKPCMVTLTFHENTQDFEYTNKEFRNYMKRLNYYIYGRKCSELRYVAVVELQKRGAIHFHILFFNLPYINLKDKKTLEEWNNLWTAGKCPDISCKDVPNNAEGIAKYITKYMTKQFYVGNGSSVPHEFVYDMDLWENKKIYFASKNLIKPRAYGLTDDEINSISYLFEDLEKETKDIICTYSDANGVLVDNFIGTSTRFKLPSERMKVLINYLNTIVKFELVEDDDEEEELYDWAGEFI